MTTITKERLQEVIDGDIAFTDEQREMARIALAVKQAQPDDMYRQNFRTAMEGIAHIRRTLEETFCGLHGTHVEPDVLVECKAICDAICSAYRQTAPVVLDEDPRDAFERSFKMPKHVTRCGTGYAVTEYSAWLAHDFIRMWEGWKACRAAMLQAGNSPVTPDGWIPVSERMPEETTDVDGGATGYLVRYAQGKEPNGGFNVGVWNVTYLLHHHHGIITHWMPLPAAPQQEVKSALEHGMQRYAGAMQKLADSGD